MSDALPEKFVAGVVEHVNQDHRAEMLELAHGLAGQRWAEDATLLHADKRGFELLLCAGGREEQVRIDFDTPLELPNQFRPALIALIGNVRRALASDAGPGPEGEL